ncbi:MAG: hypothetical protein FWD17_18770, partial [Polyangiaceae bacterium]|nr:hypothetical protein [Polyangiaceae bacterium]
DGGYLNDTWTFDGTSWTQVSVSSSPPARMYVAMAPLGNQVVLFGGYDSTSNLNDTWTFDGTAWMQVSALNVPPGLSGVMAMLPHGP